MRYLFLFIFLLSNNSIALDVMGECAKIINNHKLLSHDEKFRVALDYRENYFSISKDKEAFCLLQDISSKGHVDAEAALASFYNEGEFVEKNPKKAIEMTQVAAEKGSILALNNLGSYYFNGVYVKQDLFKAIEYYNKAVSKGISIANVSLSYAYFTGQGVKQDTNKAIELASYVIKEPKNIGYTMALTNLGFYYGAIGLKDKQIFFTEQAAYLYDPNAQVNLGIMYAKDSGLLSKEKSLYWLSKSMERHNPQAYFIIGTFYDKGTPVFEEDDKKAIEFYSKAAELGHDKAQYNLANKLFWNHQERDALYWLLKAANEHNNPNAIVSLYQVYLKGTKHIPQDLEKAEYWLERAKEHGFTP